MICEPGNVASAITVTPLCNTLIVSDPTSCIVPATYKRGAIGSAVVQGRVPAPCDAIVAGQRAGPLRLVELVRGVQHLGPELPLATYSQA